MCLAPRLPDIKANLDISTTYFGFLMSSGSIGALLAHLTMGHIVHRLGVYKVLIVSATVTYFTIGILIELKNAEIYLLVNIICGFAWASYHIAINAQALHRQAETGVQIIPMLHGLWSAGAVTTAFIALLISSTVSLNWHIYSLIITVYLLKLRAINRSRPLLLQGNEITEADEVVPFRRMISSISIDWVVSLGFLCALMLEVSIGDWATILARQEFEVSKSVAVIPYFLFMGAMIIGRLSYHRFKGQRSDKEIVQPFAVTGGTIFLTALGLSLQLRDFNMTLAFSIFCLGFSLRNWNLLYRPTFLWLRQCAVRQTWWSCNCRIRGFESSINFHWERRYFSRCRRGLSSVSHDHSWGYVDICSLLRCSCQQAAPLINN